MLFFWFFKNCELIRDSSLQCSNFIPLVRDSIIITGSRCSTYTFGSRFSYKRWIRVSIKILNFSFLGQVFQYFCWVSKRVDWGSHQIPYLLRFKKISFLSLLSFVSYYHPILFLLCFLFFILILWRAQGQNCAPSSKKNKKKNLEKILFVVSILSNQNIIFFWSAFQL